MILDFCLEKFAHYSGLSQALGCESLATFLLATVIIAVAVMATVKKSSRPRKASRTKDQEVEKQSPPSAEEDDSLGDSPSGADHEAHNAFSDECQGEDCLNMNEVEEELEEALGVRFPRGGENAQDNIEDDRASDFTGSDFFITRGVLSDDDVLSDDVDVSDMLHMEVPLAMLGPMQSTLPSGAEGSTIELTEMLSALNSRQMLPPPEAVMEALMEMESILNPEGRDLSPEERELMDDLMGRMLASATIERMQEEAMLAALEGAEELD